MCVRLSSLLMLSETRLSRQWNIPSQIRDLTFDPPYSSAAGQGKAAPVTQTGRGQLNKWQWATHECSCGVKEVGEGFGGRKEKKRRGGGGGWV